MNDSVTRKGKKNGFDKKFSKMSEFVGKTSKRNGSNWRTGRDGNGKGESGFVGRPWRKNGSNPRTNDSRSGRGNECGRRSSKAKAKNDYGKRLRKGNEPRGKPRRSSCMGRRGPRPNK